VKVVLAGARTTLVWPTKNSSSVSPSRLRAAAAG
jgi:hypothetical protein